MPTQFKHETLPNGLRVLAECDDSAHTAAIGFFVKTGARDESPEVMGVSHFLEHMMFKGSDQRTAEQVDQDFDRLGAVHNAFTSSEMTAFWAHLLPEHLERGTAILADIMRPAIRESDFNDEKKVILEEIAMYEDQPFWVLYEAVIEHFYRSHPLSHRVLGTTDTIKRLTRDQMKTYFDGRYSPRNTMVAMAGRLDFDQMLEQLAGTCGLWPENRSSPLIRTGHEMASPDQFTIRSAKVNRHYGLMAAPAPSVQSEQRYAAGVLAQILGDDEGSRLYWALIETGLAEDAAAQFDGRDGLGEYFVSYTCSPEDAERVERIVLDEIQRLKDSLTEDDLLRVRSIVATAATLHGERPSGRMRRLGHLWTYLGEYLTLEDELARINAVTLDDLRALADAYPMSPHIIGRLAPAPRGAASSDSSHSPKSLSDAE